MRSHVSVSVAFCCTFSLFLLLTVDYVTRLLLAWNPAFYFAYSSYNAGDSAVWALSEIRSQNFRLIYYRLGVFNILKLSRNLEEEDRYSVYKRFIRPFYSDHRRWLQFPVIHDVLKILKIVVLITICFIFLQLSLDNTLTRWLRFVDDVLEHTGNDNCITVKAELQWKSPSPTQLNSTQPEITDAGVWHLYVRRPHH